jgi:hypothetical protein
VPSRLRISATTAAYYASTSDPDSASLRLSRLPRTTRDRASAGVTARQQILNNRGHQSIATAPCSPTAAASPGTRVVLAEDRPTVARRSWPAHVSAPPQIELPQPSPRRQTLSMRLTDWAKCKWALNSES